MGRKFFTLKRQRVRDDNDKDSRARARSAAGDRKRDRARFVNHGYAGIVGINESVTSSALARLVFRQRKKVSLLNI